MPKAFLNKKIFIQAVLIFLFTQGCNRPTFRLLEKPILYNEDREELSLQYLKDRHGLEWDTALITPKMVVVHWTAVYSLEATFDIFNPVHLGGRPDLTNASNLNVSAHFLVDRDGTIFRLLPETTFGRHTIGLNYMAIGIENIGGPKAPLTKAQLKANTDLINWLSKKYPIEFVIGHHEYQVFKDSPYWKETDPNYLTDKNDPGPKFMKKLRSALGSEAFKSLPD